MSKLLAGFPLRVYETPSSVMRGDERHFKT